MKAQSILANALMLFVAVSVGVVIGQATARHGGDRTAQAPALAPAPAPVPVADGERAPSVVATYYHGKVRCPTCNTIESFASEAIRSGFAEALEDGSVRWESKNFEIPENEHVFEKYGLYSSSLVLVAPGKTGPDSFRVLEDVWTLTGDREAFTAYVQGELARFLELQGG